MKRQTIEPALGGYNRPRSSVSCDFPVGRGSLILHRLQLGASFLNQLVQFGHRVHQLGYVSSLGIRRRMVKGHPLILEVT
jgi:hypothetical protein